MQASCRHRVNRTKSAVVICAVVLAVIVGGLLWMNYRAEKTLRRSAWLQFYYDAERMAGSLAYFFSERVSDMLDLAESRELSIFFENKALGMSMDYGLQASLTAITEKLRQTLEDNSFHENRIFGRMVFIDTDAHVLSDTLELSGNNQEDPDWQTYLQPEIRAPAILLLHNGRQFQVLMSLAYFYKGAFAGQILSWISHDFMEHHLLKPESEVTQRRYGLQCPNGVFYANQQDRDFFSSNTLSANQEGRSKNAFKEVASGVRFVFARVPVKKTPFVLVMAAPSQDVYGRTQPWHLTLALGILSLLAAGSTGVLWRFDTRNMLLNARLEETEKRESVIQEKNIQLEQQIGRRRRMEKALRESETKYRAIFESFLDIYFKTDPNGRIEVVSPSVRNQTGYAPHALLGRSVVEFMAVPRARRRLLAKLRQRATINDHELEIISKDGTRVHVSLNARLLMDAKGGALGVEGVLRDITRRKHDEKVLQESRTRLDLALKGGDLGIWDWNVQTGQVTFSRRWTEMLEYAAGDIAPSMPAWQNLLHPEDKAGVVEILQAHLKGETPFFETEYRLRTKSGGWKWILNRGQVVEHDGYGRPLLMAGTHLDVTPRKIAELEVKKYQENLERLVEERSAELKKAQKELVAKAIEAGRAQLSAMVLHNIGNAITPVNVLMESLRQVDLDQITFYLDKCRDDIDKTLSQQPGFFQEHPRIREVLAYWGQLIDGLKAADQRRRGTEADIAEAIRYIAEILTVQQNYAASEQETRSVVDLNAVVNESIRMQTTSLEKRGIKIVTRLDRQAPKLLIDKNRLMQLIVNIIKNGYEAIDQNKDPAAAKVITFMTMAENGRVGLSIGDTGIGVEADKIDKLFEFGHSGKGSSGLGLYYCKMFVEAKRGQLEFKSPGRGLGATVSVWFDRV